MGKRRRGRWATTSVSTRYMGKRPANGWRCTCGVANPDTAERCSGCATSKRTVQIWNR